jgi:hypothetical protein
MNINNSEDANISVQVMPPALVDDEKARYVYPNAPDPINNPNFNVP